MNNYSGKIDLELLNDSIETIFGVQNLVNNVNLADNFEEIEKYFRNINFEHSYCLEYKEQLDIVYSDLNDIRDKINKLTETLTVIKNSYSNIEELEPNSIKKIIGNIKTDINDVSNENITRIEKPQTDPSLEEKPYSTVPIGIAIGATGIAGSVGAVIVNDKYGPEIAESEIEEYNYLSDDEPDFEVKEHAQKKEEEIIPYHASREDRESDKYYGNSNDLDLEDYDDTDDSFNDFDE